MEWLPRVGVEGEYASSSRTEDEFYDYASGRGRALFHTDSGCSSHAHSTLAHIIDSKLQLRSNSTSVLLRRCFSSQVPCNRFPLCDRLRYIPEINPRYRE